MDNYQISDFQDDEYRHNQELAEITTAVSIERIAAIFDSFGWKYELEGKQIRSGFEGKPFIINLSEDNSRLELFSVLLEPVLDSDENDVLGFIEEWHRTRLVPKAYLCEADPGQNLLRLGAVAILVDAQNRLMGATDEQLKAFLEQFVVAALTFYREFAEAFGVEQK